MLPFAALCASHFLDGYRLAYWLSGSPIETEDVTSDTFIRARVNIGRIRTETLRGFLFRIARDTHLGHLRKRGRETALTDPLPAPRPGPEAITEWHESPGGVVKVLGSLGEQDRAAFIIRAVHELDCAEIARVLQVSEVAARVKVHRVRKAPLEWRVRSEGKR
jgi:RNA polymerase sigma-70 factor (ECF subfamily)